MSSVGKAAAIWQAMLHDDNLFGDGRRNDDAVNLCCVCEVLGKDPMEAYREQQVHHYDHDIHRCKAKVDMDFITGRSHMERIIPYAKQAFEDYGMDIIESYGIGSASYMQVEG